MALELPATSPAGRTGSGEGDGVKAIGAPGDGSVGGAVYWYGVSGLLLQRCHAVGESAQKWPWCTNLHRSERITGSSQIDSMRNQELITSATRYFVIPETIIFFLQ